MGSDSSLILVPFCRISAENVLEVEKKDLEQNVSEMSEAPLLTRLPTRKTPAGLLILHTFSGGLYKVKGRQIHAYEAEKFPFCLKAIRRETRIYN